MDKDKVIFLNSRFVDGNDARVPNVSTIDYGEIAINYKAKYETISFKNDNGNIVRLRPMYLVDNKLNENKRVIFYQKDTPNIPKNGDIWIIPPPEIK